MKIQITEYHIFNPESNYKEIFPDSLGRYRIDSEYCKEIVIITNRYSDEIVSFTYGLQTDTIYLDPEIRYLSVVNISSKVKKRYITTGRKKTYSQSTLSVGSGTNISTILSISSLGKTLFIDQLELQIGSFSSSTPLPFLIKFYELDSARPFEKNGSYIMYNRKNEIGTRYFSIDSGNNWRKVEFDPICITNTQVPILMVIQCVSSTSPVFKITNTPEFDCACSDHCVCIIFNGRSSQSFNNASISSRSNPKMNIALHKDIYPRIRLRFYKILK